MPQLTNKLVENSTKRKNGGRFVVSRSSFKRVLICLPENLLCETDKIALTSHVSRSELIREAVKTYLEENRRNEIREMMKIGYMEMEQINLSFVEMCHHADMEQYFMYEEKFSGE